VRLWRTPSSGFGNIAPSSPARMNSFWRLRPGGRRSPGASPGPACGSHSRKWLSARACAAVAIRAHARHSPLLRTRVLLGGVRLELEADEALVAEDLRVVPRLDHVGVARCKLKHSAVVMRHAHLA
jgi:hypothetical protein